MYGRSDVASLKTSHDNERNRGLFAKSGRETMNLASVVTSLRATSDKALAQRRSMQEDKEVGVTQNPSGLHEDDRYRRNRRESLRQLGAMSKHGRGGRRIGDAGLLDHVNSRADQVKTIYLSTGMATLPQVRAAVDRLDRIDKLYLLQCTSQYPTDDGNVNLRAMQTLAEAFPHCRIGFSDHSRGIDACLAAVALGAQVIEKHFTYHVRLPGDDHAGALTPELLAELVARIERVETMLGSADKAPVAAEQRAIEALCVTMHEVGFDALRQDTDIGPTVRVDPDKV